MKRKEWIKGLKMFGRKDNCMREENYNNKRSKYKEKGIKAYYLQ